MGFQISPDAFRRAMMSQAPKDDQAMYAAENAQPGEVALPPMPKAKGASLTDTYADVPLHVLVNVGEAVDGLTFGVFKQQNPVAKALTAMSPAGMVSKLGQAAGKNIESTYDYNPKTNLAEQRTKSPVIGTAALSAKSTAVQTANIAMGPALGPMTSALLERALPDSPELTYLLSPRTTDVAHMAGEFTRQGVELHAAETAAKAFLPKAVQALSVTGDPTAQNAIGQITKFLGATQNARINVGKVLTDTLAGMGAGAVDAVADDLISPDGEYNLGKTFKKAALTSLVFGGGSAAISGIIEGSQVVKREMVKRALSNPEFVAGARRDIKVERIIREAMQEDMPRNPAQQFTPELSVDVNREYPAGYTGNPWIDNFNEPTSEKEFFLGDFGGAISQEAQRAFNGIKKMLGEKKGNVQFSATTLQEESGLGLGKLLRQLTPEERARLRFDPKTRLALGIPEDIANPELKEMATGIAPKPAPLLTETERTALIESLGGAEKPTRFSQPHFKEVGEPSAAPEGRIKPGRETEAKLPYAGRNPESTAMGVDGKPIRAAGTDFRGGALAKRVGELSDQELIQLGREQRSIEMQAAASADTIAPEGVIRPTAEKAYDAAKKNLSTIRAVDKVRGSMLTLEDMAAVSGVDATKLAKMSNSAVRALRDKHAASLKEILNQRIEANKLASNVRGRGMTTPQNAAGVTQVLQSHGVTVTEAAALLNADLNVSAAGPSKLYGNQVFASDIMTFDPKGLDNLLKTSKPEIDRLRAAKRRFLAENPQLKPGEDIDQRVLDSLNQQKPSMEQPGLDLTRAEKSVLQARAGRKNPLRATDEEALKQVIAEGDESGTAGYPSDVVKVEPHSKHKMQTAEGEAVEVDAGRSYNVSYTDQKGVEHFAILRGKQIIESDLAGVLKLQRIVDDAEFMDPLDKAISDDLGGIYLGSGLGGGEAEMKRLARNMRTKLEKMGVNIGDTFEKMDKEKFRDFILATSLPTHIMNVHPEFRHVFDAVLDKEGMTTSIRQNAERILNFDKDALILKSKYPAAYKELNGTLRTFDQGAYVGKIPTQLEYNQAIARISELAGGAKGAKLVQKVSDQVAGIRGQARDLLAKQIRETTGYAKLASPQQKLVDDFIDAKLYSNPWYQPINRTGQKHVSVVRQGAKGRPYVVRRETFENTWEAKQAIERLRAEEPGASIHFDNLKTKESWVTSPGGKVVKKANKGTAFGKDDGLVDIDDLGMAAENAAVPTISEDLNNIMKQQVQMQGMAVDSHLRPRDYTPGFRDDLVDDMLGGYRKIINNVSERYPAKVLENKKNTLLKMVEDSMASQFGPTRDALTRYASKYVDMAINAEKNPALGAGLRSGLYNWMLSYSGSFLVMNSIQTFQTSLRRAAGYGPAGLGHFVGSFASADKMAYAMISSEEKARGLISKMKLPQEHREVLSRLLNEGVIGDITTKQMVTDVEQQLTSKAKDGVSKFLTMFARISEKHNRFQDALMYTGIGRDVAKLRGDDLYNFVRRGIMETQFGLTDATLPLFVSSADTVGKSFWKTNLMFYKFATESYSRQMEGIKNFFSGVEGTGGKNLFERAEIRAKAGKSRLQMPVDIAVQLALGGITGFNTMSWATGIATGGRPGAAWVTEQGLRAVSSAVNPAWALQQLNEKFDANIPMDLSYDDIVKRMADRLGGDDGKNYVSHGLPHALGFTFGKKLAPSLPGIGGGQGSFISNYGENAIRGVQKLQTGDSSGITRMLPTAFGNIANGMEMANQSAVLTTIGREAEVVKRDPEFADYLKAYMGLQDVDVFNAKRDAKIAADMLTRREKIVNLVRTRISNEIQNSDNPSDEHIDGTLDIARAWNATIRAKGAPANLVIDVDSNDKDSLRNYSFNEMSEKSQGMFDPKTLEEKTLDESNRRDKKGRPLPISDKLAVRNFTATGDSVYENPKKRQMLDQQQ